MGGRWDPLAAPSPTPHAAAPGRSQLFNAVTAQIDDSHFRKIKVFNQDLGKLGEEVIRQNETCFYNKIREEFKNWVLTLTANTPNGKS